MISLIHGTINRIFNDGALAGEASSDGRDNVVANAALGSLAAVDVVRATTATMAPFRLSGNRLVALSRDLARMRKANVLIATGNLLTEDVNNAFKRELERVQRKDGGLGPCHLTNNYDPIDFWFKEIKTEFPEKNTDFYDDIWFLLSESEQKNLETYLQRLRETEEYTNAHTRNGHILQVSRLLADLYRSEKSRKDVCSNIDKVLAGL